MRALYLVFAALPALAAATESKKHTVGERPVGVESAKLRATADLPKGAARELQSCSSGYKYCTGASECIPNNAECCTVRGWRGRGREATNGSAHPGHKSAGARDLWRLVGADLSHPRDSPSLTRPLRHATGWLVPR
jgi:hypothetical protein